MAWDESEHPRDSDGKFTDGNGTSAKSGSIRVGEGQPAEWQGAKTAQPQPKKSTVIHVSEVRQPNGDYIFPTDFKIKLGRKEFLFDSPIVTTDVITIVRPHNLRDQAQISKNYGGRYGEWSKKAGNSMVEIGGKQTQVQIHFYQNTDGSIAGAKIIT